MTASMSTEPPVATQCPEFVQNPLGPADQDAIIAGVDGFAPEMSALARRIWENPELAFAEYRTADDMCSVLRARGFDITRGVGGLPTAFVATRRAGPAVALLAEMDALPGFSQDASPRRSPIPGQDRGHACGHHLFGAASIGAGVALADWLEATGTPGQVRVIGTPAEEGGAGKVHMARAGVFDDLALALHWHPDDRTMVWQSASLASIGLEVTFHGRTAHAAQAPHEGRSALHGVEAFHHMAALMREVIPQGTHIHYVIAEGGMAPNVIPDRAVSRVNIRHPSPDVALDVADRLSLAAEGAALGTGTRAVITRTGGVYPILPNDTVGRVMVLAMQATRPVPWDAADHAWARQLQESFTDPPPLDGIGRLGPYRFGTQGAFSTDVGDVSWLVPCGALGTVTWVPGTRPHTWQAVACGATPIADKGMINAAQGLALTAAQFLAEPALLTRARQELEQARGADFAYRPLLTGPPPV